MRRFLRLLIPLVLISLIAAACGNDDDGVAEDGDDTPADAPDDAVDEGGDDGEVVDLAGGSLMVYSGRSQELVQPVIDLFEEATGITVDVRYGNTAEMAALILEEGSRSPADVYYGQDAGALGALSANDRFATLDDALLDLVAPAYRSESGDWIGTSGRSRVLAYNTDALSEDEVPDSILDLVGEEWGGGRIGWAPTNGSFQAHVTAMRALLGDDETRDWLEGIQANSPRVYEGNTPIVEAIGAGEVEVGLVNHYYLYNFLAEDPDFPVANKFSSSGDVSALVNIAGIGVLDSASNVDEAAAFVEFMLSAEAQEYFANETFEIPLVSGVSPADGVPTFGDLTTPDIDLNRLEDLEGTVDLLTDLGIL